MKENLFFPKSLLEVWRTKFISIWLQYRKIYIDKFNEIVNEYNNKYHRTIKMKPIDVKDNTHIDSIKEVNDKDPKIKLVIMSKFQNAESFLINDIL